MAHLEINALVQQVIVTDERRRAVEEMTSRWTQLSAADEILQIGDNGPLITLKRRSSAVCSNDTIS